MWYRQIDQWKKKVSSKIDVSIYGNLAHDEITHTKKINEKRIVYSRYTKDINIKDTNNIYRSKFSRCRDSLKTTNQKAKFGGFIFIKFLKLRTIWTKFS